MITGKDLLIYILENDLLNEPIVANGRPIGFYTEDDAAVAFGVGRATIRLWIERGDVEAVLIGDAWFIPKTEKNPIERIKDETNISKSGGGTAGGTYSYVAGSQPYDPTGINTYIGGRPGNILRRTGN